MNIAMQPFANCLIAAGCLAAGLSASLAQAAEWGSLKGRFVYTGKDEGGVAKITQDAEFCGQHEIVDETIELGEKGGLQNVFVYLYLRRNDTVEIHPDYEAMEAEAKVLDNQGCRFEPHAMTLWTKFPLEIRNSDPIGHNTNAQKLVANPKFNEQISSDRPTVKKFEKSEPLPTEVACNIHPWMNAYLLIRDNPYMAVSGKDGSFEIKNLPAGNHSFIIWHEAKGYVRNLEVHGEQTDRRGQIELTIPAGETLELGEISVTPELLDQ